MNQKHPKFKIKRLGNLALFLLVFLVFSYSYAQENKKGILFSHASGFYAEPFELTISSEPSAGVLNYTIDGSDPAISETRISTSEPADIWIDPTIEGIRPSTPAFIVRAIVTQDEVPITEYASWTFIFLDQVMGQSYPGFEWPLGSSNGQRIDLDMDSKVVNDPKYENVIDDALLSIPSISVVTDNDNLFHWQNGIYVNAHGHGKEWERHCSIELINPDGSKGFFENAGLRIRGGWSRHPEFAKHAFRVFFREEYGTDKLRFPLFEDEGVSEFDKIDLRCAQNYAWSNSDGRHNTFVREVFSRDSQRDMGQPYTRSRYYHLYLNGMYWGLYQTQERSEARFAESYFGGDKSDYDVIKVNVENYVYEMEATDGTLNTWQQIWGLSQTGFSNNSSYFSLMGKNSIGNANKDADVLVDIDNLIDYMIIIFFTGNFDSPVTQFRENDYPNNIYAIFNREDHSQGFKFFIHDAEHSLMVSPVTAGHGINEDRVNLATITGPERMEITEFRYFNPQWLHYKLSENEEYRMRFADRASKHLSHGGVFSYEKSIERFNKRVKEIDLAIIGESARWGDTQSYSPFTKDNAWIPELNDIRQNFFPNRGEIVINQLKQAGLYADLKSVDFVVDNKPFYVQEYQLEEEITIKLENPNSSGTIFYTLDGNDPRLVGGATRNNAIQIEDGRSLTFSNSTVLNTRILSGDTWSAIRTLHLKSDSDDLSNLKITEIHYHPKELIQQNDTLKSKDLEFIEFKNTGETALNLSGITIDSAIQYTFPENTILPPGQFYVVASKPAIFYDYYALEASGNFKGNLSNGGEQIVVADKAGNIIIDMTYHDSDPWPDKADGDGPSLAAIYFNPTQDPSQPEYWRISIYEGGTPFRDDELITGVEEELLSNSSIRIYPNPASDYVKISVPFLTEAAILNVNLYDLNGKKLAFSQLRNNSDFSLPTANLDTGMKILTISHNDFFSTAKIVFKR